MRVTEGDVSLGRTAARGAVVTVGGQALRGAVQFLGVALLSRLLTPTDFGVYAMVFALVGIASLLADFGLSMASVQSSGISDAQRSNLFWLNLVFGCCMASGIYLLAKPISMFYGSPALEPITHVIAPAFLLDAAAAQFRAELNANLRFGWLALADILSQAFGLATGCLLAATGHHYWALVWQQVVIVGVGFVVVVLGARWVPGMPERAPMRRLLTFGGSTFGVQALVYITSNIDNVVLGRTVDAATLGAYGRAYQLFRLPLAQIAAPMTKVAFPILSRVKDDPVLYGRYLHRGQFVLSYIFGGSFLTLAGLSGPLVEILLGDQWDRAKEIFVILAIGGCFQAMGYVYYWVFLSKALTGIQLKYSLISRSLMVVAIVVGAEWGAVGVAAGASAGLFFAWLFNAVFAMRSSGVAVRPLLMISIRPLMLFAPVTVMGLVVSASMGHQDSVVQAAIILAITALYLGSATLLPSVRRDLGLLLDTARRVRSL